MKKYKLHIYEVDENGKSPVLGEHKQVIERQPGVCIVSRPTDCEKGSSRMEYRKTIYMHKSSFEGEPEPRRWPMFFPFTKPVSEYAAFCFGGMYGVEVIYTGFHAFVKNLYYFMACDIIGAAGSRIRRALDCMRGSLRREHSDQSSSRTPDGRTGREGGERSCQSDTRQETGVPQQPSGRTPGTAGTTDTPEGAGCSHES